MKMTVSRKLLVVGFILSISLPFVGRYAYFGSTPNKILVTENRKVAPYQELESLKSRDLKKYFKNLDRYIADRLVGKDTVVGRLNSYVGDPEYFINIDYSKGVIGKDGFVFLGDNYSRVISRHFRSDFLLKDEEIISSQSKHNRLMQSAKAVGAEYYLFVAPDKHGIYCEKFPEWLMSHSCDRVTSVTDKLIAGLKIQGIRVVYPFEYLRSRNDERLYYKTDTHWNLLGAKYGFLPVFSTSKCRKARIHWGFWAI